MSVVLIVLVVVLASPLGGTFVLQLSEKEATDPAIPASSVQRTSR